MTGALSTIIAFAALGLPLFCVLGAVGLVGLYLRDESMAGALAALYGKLTGAEAVSLSTIPLFTFAGYLMARARTAQRLVELSEAILGWIPGGLAVMTVVTCAFFTTFTGASGVTIVALGGLLLPELVKSGYSTRRSLEVVTGSGAVGLLFPPSLPLIVYGIIYALNAGQASDPTAPTTFSVERFLFAGVVPGLVLIAVLCVYCIAVGLWSHTPRKPIDLGGFARALWAAKWEVPIPFLVIWLLATGKAVIPEVAALTALYVFVIEVFIYRDISLRRDLFTVTRESMTLVGAIFMKISAAFVLTEFFIAAEVPQRLFEWMSQFVTTSGGFLLVLNVLLLIVGCLMDIFSAIVVVVPLIVPAAAQFHIDPYHLGVVFLINLEIGYLLPPAGLNLFIAAFRFNRPITELYRAVVPFILLMLGTLLLVTYVPKLVVVPRLDHGQEAVKLESTDAVDPGKVPPPSTAGAPTEAGGASGATGEAAPAAAAPAPPEAPTGASGASGASAVGAPSGMSPTGASQAGTAAPDTTP